MRRVEALVRHYLLDRIREALVRAGVNGITITEVHGFGRQKGRLAFFRGSEYDIDFVPKIKMEMIVDDDQVPAVVDVILQQGRTGEVGDGKVFISNILNAIRIRTGEEGLAAIH